MTSEELAEIERRANAAMSGPWQVNDGGYSSTWVGKEDSEGLHTICSRVWSYAEAEFIASARSDVPALLVEVHRLTDIVDAALAVKAARHVLQQALNRLADQGDDDVSLNAAYDAAAIVFGEAQWRFDVLLGAYELLNRKARSDG